MSYGVSVTGMGCLCAAGEGVSQVMAALYAGKRNFCVSERIGCDHEVAYPVFEVSSIPRGTPSDSVSVCMLMAVIRQALDQAGLSAEDVRGKRVGVCIGTTTGASLNFADDYVAFRRNGKEWGNTPQQLVTWLCSNPALAVAEHLLLSGPCQTIVNACSSGTDAVGMGMSWLEQDVCDIVLAGGVDELSAISFNGFIKLGIYDAEPCKPFDAQRKGLNLGEGAAILVLEKVGDAAARGGRTLARCAGYGTSADAYHLTAPSRDGAGLSRAIHTALQRAGLSAGDIGFVNVHGTGTPDNDAVESLVLARELPHVLVSATKGYTGHTLGAAGAIESVFVVQALLEKMLPPSAGFSSPAPDCGCSPVRQTTAMDARYGLSQSLAFGGNNSVIIFAGEQ